MLESSWTQGMQWGEGGVDGRIPEEFEIAGISAERGWGMDELGEGDMEMGARDSGSLLQGWEVDEWRMEVLARWERKTGLRRWYPVDLYSSVIPWGILLARRSLLATTNTCASHSSHLILSKDVFSSPFPFTIVTAAHLRLLNLLLLVCRPPEHRTRLRNG